MKQEKKTTRQDLEKVLVDSGFSKDFVAQTLEFWQAVDVDSITIGKKKYTVRKKSKKVKKTKR